jgi:hypothetical protein
MNRPLKRKLENLAMKYLDANKTGKAYADISLVTSGGTTLADEVAIDAGSAASTTAEPSLPFIMCLATITPDSELPGVAAFELTVHLSTDATGIASDRNGTDEILRDLYDVLIAPSNDAAAFDDSNKEFGALVTYANKPGGSDTRQTYRKPLHVYNMWLAGNATQSFDDCWHDQIILGGHAQDMDNS